MKIQTNLEKYLNDYNELLKMFDPSFEEDDILYSIMINEQEDIFETTIKINNKEYSFTNAYGKDKNAIEKKLSKINFYDALSAYYNKTLEWGSLTGVRPTKIAYKLLDAGTPEVFLKEELVKQYRLSENKAKLLREIVKNQKCIIKNDNLVDVYVNIPICPSRCKYCSFISAEYSAVEKIVPDYLKALIKEIAAIKQIVRDKNLIVRSIYIGGGTPSVLTSEDLNFLLDELNFSVNEFTVECGRADTITREKLQVLKNHGVTRICINPQTFVEKTLKAIGRKHTVKDVLKAYALALEFGFDINLDLIAGLEGETFSNFKKSINSAIEMAPQNITVHTLAIKRGSNLSLENLNKPFERETAHELEVKKMIDYAQQRLFEEGYKPYYIYRQKNTPMGLENVGFALKNKVCVFNVDSMEETCSVLACGANAISKRIFNLENRIERADNVKFLHDYIERIDEMIERKKQLFN